MKIFLTGASGLVGGAFARRAAAHGHLVVGVVGRFPGELPGVAERAAMDLTDEQAAARAVLAAAPDAIVNGAAVSEPAMCDADPARSEAMNVGLPALLARLASQLGARLVHLSSEQAFDGERNAPYTTGAAPAPINLYGRQKVASERAVLAAAPTLAAVVRAPLLMGDSPSGRRSLHERLLSDWATGRPVKLYTDEFRQPCTAANLAEAMLELVERRDLNGVFHWAGAELLSRHEAGVRIREHFKLSERVAPIAAITRAQTPEAAKQRQACLALDLAPLAGTLRTRPQTFAEQLATLQVPAPVLEWLRTVG